MHNSKTRVLEYIDYKGISKNEFYKKTGLSNGFLDKTNNIGADKLEIIISIYNDLNLFWVITGKGEMIVNYAKDYAKEYAKLFPNVHDKLGINEPKENYKNDCPCCQEKEKIIEALQKTVSSMERTVHTQLQLIEMLKEKVPVHNKKQDKKESKVA